MSSVKRVKRIPLHQQNVFMALNRPGFKRMWVNEYTGAVESHELAGWSVVKEDMKTSDGQVQVESQVGSVVRRVVNKDPSASCKTAVLMEIPEDIYLEDQLAEQSKIDEIEKKYNSRPGTNQYGTVEITH